MSGSKEMKNTKYRYYLNCTGIVFAMIIAVMYLFIVPSEAEKASGFSLYVLRYAHSLCWVLIAVACMLFLIKNKRAVYFLYGALAVYCLFVGTLLAVK